MRILVTGASGFIGKALVKSLSVDGHEVYAAVRSPKKVCELPDERILYWDASIARLDERTFAALSNADAVIHLAGESIAGSHWTEERKAKLWDSRVRGTENLVQNIGLIEKNKRPKILISVSGIGIYDYSTDIPQDEAKDEYSSAGKGFISSLCVAWESAAKKAEDLGLRVVIPRLGVVLDRENGALPKMGMALIGDGSPWISWIHIQDVLKMITAAVTQNSYSGVYNLASPNPVRQRDLLHALEKKSGKPLTLKVPAAAVKIGLGEMSSILLEDQQVIPKRLNDIQFTFQFPSLELAMEGLYQNDSYLDQRFSASQFVPAPREKVFDFFSRAENLESITPPWLNFNILSSSTPTITRGTLIHYQLRLHGIPLRWKTKISEWQPSDLFVDDQLKGPFSKWSHLHTFYTVPGGTLICDQVTFRAPGGIFGKVSLIPWIQKDVKAIFEYRKLSIQKIFQN